MVSQNFWLKFDSSKLSTATFSLLHRLPSIVTRKEYSNFYRWSWNGGSTCSVFDKNYIKWIGKEFSSKMHFHAVSNARENLNYGKATWNTESLNVFKSFWGVWICAETNARTVSYSFSVNTVSTEKFKRKSALIGITYSNHVTIVMLLLLLLLLFTNSKLIFLFFFRRLVKFIKNISIDIETAMCPCMKMYKWVESVFLVFCRCFPWCTVLPVFFSSTL